jgi:hypothetical protein
MLRSSKMVNKRAPPMSAWLRWTTPHPGHRPDVELPRGHPRSKLDLLVVSEVLAGQSLPTEHPPPCLLEVQPARKPSSKPPAPLRPWRWLAARCANSIPARLSTKGGWAAHEHPPTPTTCRWPSACWAATTARKHLCTYARCVLIVETDHRYEQLG